MRGYSVGMRNSMVVAAVLQTSLLSCGCSPRVCDDGFELQTDGNCYPAEKEADLEPETDANPPLDTGENSSADTATSGDSAADTGTASPVNQKADFQLEDFNPSSPRYGEAVSPRDYLKKVSGWYFLHAN